MENEIREINALSLSFFSSSFGLSFLKKGRSHHQRQKISTMLPPLLKKKKRKDNCNDGPSFLTATLIVHVAIGLSFTAVCPVVFTIFQKRKSSLDLPKGCSELFW